MSNSNKNTKNKININGNRNTLNGNRNTLFENRKKPNCVYIPSTDSVEKKPDQPQNPFKKGKK